jgi:hypothetical protein
MLRPRTVAPPTADGLREVDFGSLRRGGWAEAFHTPKGDVQPLLWSCLVSGAKRTHLVVRNVTAVLVSQFMKRNRWFEVQVQALSKCHESCS